MPEQRWYEPYRWHFAAWELALLVPVALMIASLERLKNHLHCRKRAKPLDEWRLARVFSER